MTAGRMVVPGLPPMLEEFSWAALAAFAYPAGALVLGLWIRFIRDLERERRRLGGAHNAS